MILARAEADQLESNLVRVGENCESIPPPGYNLLHIEPNKESKRNIAHEPSSIDTDQLKHFFVVGIVDEDTPVEKAEESVKEDKGDEVVID